MKRSLLLLITLSLFVFDQVTKWLVLRSLDLDENHTIIPGLLDLVHVTNTGAAFGTFQNGNLIFMILSAGTLAGLLIFFFRGSFTQPVSQLAVSLLAAGILGNLTDRIFRHHVIDFLDFHLGNKHWPAFNVADSCICVAVAILIFDSLRSGKKELAAS
jgi:signal peptidase II